MSLERKLKRKKKVKNRKLEERIKNQMMMFDQIPEQCLACEKDFDKQDKEMATTWNVVVRESENIVRLYCPTCWSTAQRVVEDYAKRGKE